MGKIRQRKYYLTHAKNTSVQNDVTRNNVPRTRYVRSM